MSKLLIVNNLTKDYLLGISGRRRIRAVNNVSFEVGESEMVSLVGESGSGKTTIARIILRLIPPTSGSVLYKGRDVWKLEGKELDWYRSEVQAVFQDPYTALNPFYKVDRALHVAVKKFLPEDDPNEITRKVLEMVKLNPDEVLGRFPHQLSGGQLQRILIARALIPNPKLLIADELISMVDMSIRIDILNLLRELIDKLGMSVIFITHEMNLALYASDKVIVLYSGEVVEEGSADKIIKNPLHPYTKLLIESIPAPGIERSKYIDMVRKMERERGSIQSLGCPFYNRCPYALEKCKAEKPPRIDVKGVKVLCWLYV